MKLLFVTDTHQRGTNPSCRQDDFPASLEAKIREVGDLARRHGVREVIHGGDLWDAPMPALAVAGRFLSAWREALGEIPMRVVPGNHDLLGHNPALLHRTMLGLGASLGLYQVLGREPVVLEEDGVSVQLTGQAYHWEIDRRDPALDYVVDEPQADFAIHIVHGMLVREPLFPGAPYTTLEAFWDRTAANLTLAGHNHLGFPLTERNGRLFYNPGALVRLTADPREWRRPIQALLIEVGPHGIDLTDLPLQSALPEAEARREGARYDPEAEERQARLRAFVDAVRQAGRRPGEDVLALLDRLAGELGAEHDVLLEAKQLLLEVITQQQEQGERVAP